MDYVPPEILQYIFEFVGIGPARARLRMVSKAFRDQVSRELAITSYTAQQKSIISEIIKSKRRMIRCILPKCGKKVIINTIALMVKKPIIVFTKRVEDWRIDTRLHFGSYCRVSIYPNLSGQVVLCSEYENINPKQFSYIVFYYLRSKNIKLMLEFSRVIRFDSDLNYETKNPKIHAIKHYVIKDMRIRPVYINIEAAINLASYDDHCDLKAKMQKLHRSGTYSSEVIQKYRKIVEFSMEEVINCLTPHLTEEHISTDLQVGRISVYYHGWTQDFYFMPTMDEFVQILFRNLSLSSNPVIYILYPGINYYKFFYKQFKTFIDIRKLRSQV